MGLLLAEIHLNRWVGKTFYLLPQAQSLLSETEEGGGCGERGNMLRGKAEMRAVAQPGECSAVLTMPRGPGYGHLPGCAPLHMCTDLRSIE